MTIKTSYWICTTPRSGSSLLSQLLSATAVAGRPAEYFWRDNEAAHQQQWNVSSYSGYLGRALSEGTTPNGVFGTKLEVGVYLAHFERQLRTLPQFSDPTLSLQSIVAAVFPNLQFIYLSRRNKVRQAVSWWKAIQSNQWGRHKGEEPTAAPDLHYNFAALDQLISESVMREAAWQAYFSEWNVKPLTLVYEDFTADHPATLATILNLLNISDLSQFDPATITLLKQSDELSEQWVQRYREEKQQGWTNRAW